MERYYSIAGTVIRLVSSEESPIRMFEGFECEPAEDVLLTLNVKKDSPIGDSYGIRYFDCKAGYPHVLLGSSNASREYLMSNDDWSEQVICGGNGWGMNLMELLASGFYSRLALNGGLLMHASVVEYQGEAVIFTAASGTGKTTQAMLWEKYLGATILNGDKVFLRPDGDKIQAWGSPWKGSSPYAVNACAPVKAIVVLAQGPENTIRKLDAFETMEKFMTHIFFPHWDENCMAGMMESLDAVAEKIPVYYLVCRPDEEAVQVTKEMLWNC